MALSTIINSFSCIMVSGTNIFVMHNFLTLPLKGVRKMEKSFFMAYHMHPYFKTSPYLIGQNFGGQICRKSDLLQKILSAEMFCPPKILSAEIFCPLKYKTCQINTNVKTYFSCELYEEIRNR